MKRGDIIDYDTGEGTVPAIVLNTNDESDNAVILVSSYEGYWTQKYIPLDYQTDEQKSDAEKRREQDEADRQNATNVANAAQTQQNQNGQSVIDARNDNTNTDASASVQNPGAPHEGGLPNTNPGV